MSASVDRPGWKVLEIPGLMAAIGPVLSKKDADGRFRYGVEATDVHVNYSGVVHGGTIAALLDQAMSLVAWHAAGRVPMVTVHMDLDFLNAAKPGDFLETVPEIREHKSSLLFVGGVVLSGERMIAKASAIMKALKPREDGEA